MKFSRLRLSGFKSFVDPVDLDILPGLTGVVGPNGCGKSNLLEALRWVMGETSYKSMRGSGMEDVIFSGTNGRPSRNNAEVTLFLDNQEHDAPPEFNGEDELEVTRRIERDIGSAYRINGKDVRARDVQLLFADASTGARSPALVKQGQIGELINAKPENRRKILEEAAGISGLHTRRHEAELRLRGAENNLEKVEDALANLHSQLRALKRQARQATRYRNLSGQIREVEALALHLRWQQAVDAKAEATQALKDAETAVNELTGRAAAASKVQLELQEKLPPMRHQEAEAAATLRRLVVEREGLENEAARARETIEKLTAQLETIARDRTHEEAIIADAGEQLLRLTAEKEKLDSAFSSEEQAAEKHAEEQMRRSAAELETAEKNLDDCNRKMAEQTAKIAETESSIAGFESRMARLQAEMDRLGEERDKLLSDSFSEAEKTALEQALEQATARESKAAEQAAQAQENLTRLSDAADSLAEPAKQAQAAAERLLGEQAALSAIFAAADDESWPSLVDVVSVENGYETALGAALGDDLDASPDAAAPAHWRDLPPMDSPSDLPAGVQPLGDFVSGSKLLARRLSQIGVVTQAQGQELHPSLKTGQRLVTREGDLWRWDGYCTMAEAPTGASKRLAQRNRLKELAPEVEQAQQQAKETKRKADEKRLQAREAAEQDRHCRQALKSAQQELAEAREALATLERGAAKHVSRLAAIEEALQRMTSDMQETETALEMSREDHSVLALDTTLSENRQSQQVLVKEARDVLARHRAAQEGLVRERTEREARLGQIGQEMESWQSRQSRSQQQLDALGVRAKEAIAEKQAAENLPAELQTRQSALQDQIGLAETNRQAAADRLAEGETALAEADRQDKTMQGSLAEARELRARLEATLEAGSERVAECGQRIRETVQCEPEEALSIANHDADKPFPAADDIEAKLERYRRERENLGAVNLRADEEAEEIASQIEEIQKEHDDLAQAINKLRYGIGQLNKEGRERLLAAFDTVNGHFKHLFTQLFGGGTAELKLTESDDPLEAGLEIIAHPPGKKPQVMSLLSGGEQALTAMSLIFAVFLTNPSPICVLDEVDAPLDDTNVERFCNMIADIAKTSDTRFLIITHHALTMARVNRLFGVTMQERGVSQLISVDLATAEQFAESGRNAAGDENKSAVKSAG